MMKWEQVMWGIYLGGSAVASAFSYDIDGVILAYTPQSSVARKALESFLEKHPEHRDRLSDAPGRERPDVTVKLARRGSAYRVNQIIERDQMIYQTVDTPEEFTYIERHFGLGSEFTRADLSRALDERSLEIDPEALRSFVTQNVAHRTLNNPENLRLAFFYGVLLDRYGFPATLLRRARQEMRAIFGWDPLDANGEQRPQTIQPSIRPQWPEEERRAFGND
ncbi:MAG: hypothetical protein LBD54_02570, partial [Puniceicoccales bacterium]|nr:hypothetical protein [Puniceicoccales bacterium]